MATVVTTSFYIAIKLHNYPFFVRPFIRMRGCNAAQY